MKYTVKYEKGEGYEDYSIHGEDAFIAIEDFKRAIEKHGKDLISLETDDAAMEMAYDEMRTFDGYEEAEECDSLDDFQYEVSTDQRTNCDIAMGESVASLIDLQGWDRICYLGALLWVWRNENFDEEFNYDCIDITIVEVE